MEENKLYSELFNLREELQERYRYYGTGKKPSICSERTIDLLVQYRPKTLEDLEMINGVGKTFIDNYGNEFIKVINKNSVKDNVEISDSEKDVLSKLENRLVNINRKNRLLYCNKINKDWGLDLTKLISNCQDLEKFIIKRDNDKFNLTKIEDLEENKISNLLRIIRKEIKIEKETGNNELYIAYPFVQGNMETENFNIKAPLMLFPIKLERTNDNIFLTNDTARNIIYNTTLILANNKFNGKNEILPDNAIEDDEFDEDNYLENMISYYNDNKFFIQNNECEIENFLENRTNEFPKYRNGKLEVKKYMVLGLYSTYVTSMYADFHNMIENNNITELIKELISGNQDSDINIQYEESDTDQKNEKIENKISYINELDYSQEQVVNEINNNKSIVVQGPPGTGKSQTITSIISQFILKGKKILMVSEKKTALDVIYSRLGELSKFAIIVDDVENKQEFYDKIDSIIKSLNMSNSLSFSLYETPLTTKEEIESKVKNINDDLDCLEIIAKKIYEINDFGTNMYNVYRNCEKIDSKNLKEVNIYNFITENIDNNIKSIKFSELLKIKEKFNNEEFSSKMSFYLSTIDESPLLNYIKQNLDDIELTEFNQNLIELKDYIASYNNLSFIKKIFEKKNFFERVKQLGVKYFNEYNLGIENFIISDIDGIMSFLAVYSNFVENKYLYDKLLWQEKEYLKLINKVSKNYNISYINSNDLIYNCILYNIIKNFQNNNHEVLRYIDNFDVIRSNIQKNIFEKKELTIKLAFNLLKSNAKKMNDNNRISKIEEMCNRKRKMSINKFMSKYKFEMLDSINVWLMTPEVVSDILPLEKDLFDLVIFDEASQLYVEKSIPAIYRAKKVVVAGDDKQLKPSSLGQGRIFDEIDEEELNDGFLEYNSLLDASKYKFKSTMLKYHYRSKYEELINFSNYAFYKKKLFVTSLANQKNNKPIERIKIEDGLYIDKKNEKEAIEVVKLIKNILKTRKNNETIGVITFNSSQMNLIEDMIEKEKSIDSDFNVKMIAEEQRTLNGENIGFFVKNIETVQGDERDIIIFCIGYAKNETGRVAINFGWLSQEGGENRLNVAISRAKEKIYVVTSIEPEDLVVDDTQHDGPKLFKKYLEYTKAISNGDKDLSKAILNSLLDFDDVENEQLNFDSEFEEEVYEKLKEEGFNVTTQYGVGGYKIDLVIKNKTGKKNLLGIECDGRIYHSSKYARERDYHRQKYLESRGWKIYRIWSSNWWKNPNAEIEKLKKYVNSLQDN